MTAAIGFDTARWYWRLVSSGQLPEPTPSRVASASTFDAGFERLSAMDRKLLDKLGSPTTLLVPAEADRRVRRDLVCRVVKSHIPVGSLMSAGDDLLVPSPEHCFLQLAQDSSVGELVLAGLELCGGYSIMPGADGGFTSHNPITTSRKLERYLKKAGGLHGIKRARRALQWIIDGSESLARLSA